MTCNGNHSEGKRKKIALVNPELRGIIPGILDSWMQQIHIMRHAFDRNDFEAIRDIGHKMKGTGGVFGFGGVTEMGGILETAAINRNKTGISKTLQLLARYMEQVEVVYQRSEE